jgi:hypothetical protein
MRKGWIIEILQWVIGIRGLEDTKHIRAAHNCTVRFIAKTKTMEWPEKVAIKATGITD